MAGRLVNMYVDEEILKQKKLIREMADKLDETSVAEEKKTSILDGKVPIYGEEFVFTKREVENTNIAIIIPEIFEKLDDETRKMMFPMGNAPEMVFSSDRDLFNVAFKKTSHIVPQDYILEFTKISCQLLERMGPQSKILKKYTYKLEELEIGIMEFLTMAMDGRVYNINCLIPFEDGVMIVSFTFLSKVKERIYPIIIEIVHNLEITKKEN